MTLQPGHVQGQMLHSIRSFHTGQSATKRYVDSVTQIFKSDADNTIGCGFSACSCRSCDRDCTGHKLRYTGHPKQVSSSEIMKLGGELQVEDRYELKDKLRDTKAY